MAVRKTKTTRAAAGGAALLALGAGAVTAQAVTASTYSVSEIRQTSLVRATSDTAAGSFDDRAFTSFRFTGRGTGNRFTVRHSTRAFPAGITRRAQRGERTGRMEFLSNQAPAGTTPSTCAIGTRAIPARERTVSLLVVPPARNTTTRPKKLQINVRGPDALGEISEAVRTGRCRTPILSPRTKLARGGSSRSASTRSRSHPTG